MANFEAVTACNGIKLKSGVEEYLSRFQIVGEDINAGVDDDGTFHFYGYSWPSFYDASDDDMETDVEDEFWKGMRKFVPKGKKLIIHMIGHEKCRYPLSAQAIIITSTRVKYESITC